MKKAKENSTLRDNLIELQMESAKLVAYFVAVIGYFWLVLLILPLTGRSAPVSAWVGVAILILSVTGYFILRGRFLGIALHVLIWGIFGAIVCAILTFQTLTIICLLTLPVIFASVLLDQREVFLIAVVASLFALTIGLIRIEASPLLIDVILPIAVIILVTIALWLSARNLHIALDWVWNGYEQARHNEQIARNRQAELRRILKALDEASYRFERTNYMLKLARDQAEEARRLKQQFAQTVSHELRTPINLIVGFTEVMTQSPEYYGEQLPLAYMRDLRIVHRNARHLQTMLNDVLDLARIEAAQMGILPEEVDLTMLVQEAVDTARNLVERRGLVLHTDIEPGLPRIWIDPIRIRQVLFNLLNNAARFTEEGSVTVRVQQQEDEVLFAVADTGIGVASEDIDCIFEEFQQRDGSRQRRHGGIGLGLAISKRFVALHGGRIGVESDGVPGLGSTFYFKLPVNRTGRIVTSGNRPAGTKSIGPGKASEEPVLLTVTDSSSAATLLTRYVHGCRTVVVPDLEQARQMARQLMPQAVIIDRASEDLNLTELENLPQEWGLPRTPFMMCPLPGKTSLQQRLAVDGYLVQPISRQSLWNILRQFGERVDRVLVIDDDDDFVQLLSRMLDSPVRRYRVNSAYSGQEGLTMMRHRQPDLVLLDLMLPDMHGSEVIKAIRSTPKWQQIPIIVVSAPDEMDIQEVLRGGVMVVKEDGLKLAELVQWVQNVVNSTVTPLPAPPVLRTTPVL
jgi:signal transduction histidine kinase/CheY-like chemotaxis protein